IRDRNVTGVQTCALPICLRHQGWVEGGPGLVVGQDDQDVRPAVGGCMVRGRADANEQRDEQADGEDEAVPESTVHDEPPWIVDRSEERRVGKGGGWRCGG